MPRSARYGLWIALFLLVFPGLAQASRDIENATIHITNYAQRADWDTPWEMGSLGAGTGTGFVIEGGWIMTNAHVVSDSRMLQVRRFQDATPYVARVEMIGHDCDLAVLKVDDPAFYKGIKPLRFEKRLPKLRSTVRTYGYPTGGRELSSTEGVVSRIEYRLYVHSANDSHLAAQTDAAINPGNSGGPVIQAGKVVGVAFQSISGLNDTGFFIPYPVIAHFLDDVRDGTYHGFADFGAQWSRLMSPAYRRYVGMQEGMSGIVIDHVLPRSSADGVLEPGDVLLRIAGKTIDNDGTIELGDHRVEFIHPMEIGQVGDRLRLDVLRKGKRKQVELTMQRFNPYDRSRRQYGVLPKYYVFAGLVFMPLDVELLATHGGRWHQSAPKRLVYNHLYRGLEEPEVLHQNVVVMVRRLPDPVNTRMAWHRDMVVEKVNGKTIRSLEDLVAAIEGHEGERHQIRYQGWNRIESINRVEANKAAPRIMERYGIENDRRL